jgi:hypothetical protein
VDNEHFSSRIVELGGGARIGLYYEPKKLAANSHVAVLYSDRNFGVEAPAADLASRGYRALYVSYPPLPPGENGTPYDGFLEVSRGITFLRSLTGVERVVIEGWGAGAGSVILYANLAANGPAACQRNEILFPCKTEQASSLAKPDGVVLLDPGGGGTRAANIDPAYDGATRRRSDLDMYSPANGYDVATGTAQYSTDFRKRYFAAQQARNEQVLNGALARFKALQAQGKSAADEPMFVPGAVNSGEFSSLVLADLSLLSHTKKPHVLLKADGSKPMAILRSIRPPRGPVGDKAIQAVVSKTSRPADPRYSLQDYLASVGSRTTRDYAITEDDVRGIDWKMSLSVGGASNAAGISVPTLIATMTCFQFVVGSEITFDQLASRDKTMVGVEGSEHEFTPCKPEYGDTRTRLFDYIGEWLGKPGRF